MIFQSSRQFSVFSISDSELAAEAETAAADSAASSSTRPDAAETQPSFRASSSTRQIAQLPPVSTQTHDAGEMPHGLITGTSPAGRMLVSTGRRMRRPSRSRPSACRKSEPFTGRSMDPTPLRM
ncbi:unnamed protein product, partial [Symbiodinium sp. CCMP2456]